MKKTAQFPLIDTHIRLLELAAHTGSMKINDFLLAVEQLKDPSDMLRYFQELKKLCRGAVRKALKRGEQDNLTNKIRAGESTLDDVAELLARDKLGYVLGHYNNRRIPNRWNKAIPTLHA